MMIDDAEDALRAGGRCVFDARLWRDLVVALFSWAALGKAVLAIVAVAISLPLLVLLPKYINWAPGFLVATWVGSSIMRRTGAIIAARALVAAPARGAGCPQPLPPTSTYVIWWLPLLFCSAVLPQALAALPWGHSPVASLALLLVQIAVAPGAIVRNILAPRFPVATIAAALRRRRGFWTLVTLAYLLALGMLQWLTSLASAGG